MTVDDGVTGKIAILTRTLTDLFVTPRETIISNNTHNQIFLPNRCEEEHPQLFRERLS
jgi:hypothetical protein